MDTSINEKALYTVVKSCDRFSFDLYKTIIEEKKSNLICSPISVSIVLSMVTCGAGGNTREQLASALHLSPDDDVNKMGYQALVDILNTVKGVELRLANKIFVRTDFGVKPLFMSIMKDYFRSASQLVDFGNSDVASDTVNKWCADNTNNRIKKVIDPADVNVLTALVLVNAIYFKGFWLNKFNAKDTRPTKFYIDRNTTKRVPMMRQTAKFNFDRLSGINAQYIELPYKSSYSKDEMSMFIILPHEIDGLKDVETNLHRVDFKKLHESHSLREVELELPKFKLESSIELNDIVKKMGMTDMLDRNKADFSSISNVAIWVSKVIQKAFIEVNEEGSEAAAVTAVIMQERCLPPRKPKFVADRPFFCTIVATYTGAQLFNARVIDPTLN